MTTDPTRPTDPSEPPSAPPPTTPPPSVPPPSEPPPSSPPPVGTADPLGPAAGSYPGAAAPAPETAAYPPPAAAYPPPATTEGAGFAPPPASSYGTGHVPSTPASSPTQMSFDRTKVSTLDLGFGGAAVLYLIALLLPWLTVSAGPLSQSGNGFNSGKLTFAWILLLAAAVVALLPAVGVDVKLPFPRAYLLLGLTGLAALLTIIEVIDVLGSTDDLGPGVDVSTGIGAWLGLLVALGAVALAVLALRGPQVARTV
jgi:hypothetical protein